MNKRIFISIALVVILGALLVSVTQVAAKAAKITTCGLQTDYEVIPGKAWFSDDNTILHMRDQTTYAHITPLVGHPECDQRFSNADLVMEVNFDLNLATGVGNTHGKVTIYPDGFNGTWQGTYSGQIRDYAMNGKSATHGSGELDGMLNKISIQEIGYGQYEFFGYVLDPGGE